MNKPIRITVFFILASLFVQAQQVSVTVWNIDSSYEEINKKKELFAFNNGYLVRDTSAKPFKLFHLVGKELKKVQDSGLVKAFSENSIGNPIIKDNQVFYFTQKSFSEYGGLVTLFCYNTISKQTISSTFKTQGVVYGDYLKLIAFDKKLNQLIFYINTWRYILITASTLSFITEKNMNFDIFFSESTGRYYGVKDANLFEIDPVTFQIINNTNQKLPGINIFWMPKEGYFFCQSQGGYEKGNFHYRYYPDTKKEVKLWDKYATKGEAIRLYATDDKDILIDEQTNKMYVGRADQQYVSSMYEIDLQTGEQRKLLTTAYFVSRRFFSLDKKQVILQYDFKDPNPVEKEEKSRRNIRRQVIEDSLKYDSIIGLSVIKVGKPLKPILTRKAASEKKGFGIFFEMNKQDTSIYVFAYDRIYVINKQEKAEQFEYPAPSNNWQVADLGNGGQYILIDNEHNRFYLIDTKTKMLVSTFVLKSQQKKKIDNSLLYYTAFGTGKYGSRICVLEKTKAKVLLYDIRKDSAIAKTGIKNAPTSFERLDLIDNEYFLVSSIWKNNREEYYYNIEKERSSQRSGGNHYWLNNIRHGIFGNEKAFHLKSGSTDLFMGNVGAYKGAFFEEAIDEKDRPFLSNDFLKLSFMQTTYYGLSGKEFFYDHDLIQYYQSSLNYLDQAKAHYLFFWPERIKRMAMVLNKNKQPFLLGFRDTITAAPLAVVIDMETGKRLPVESPIHGIVYNRTLYKTTGAYKEPDTQPDDDKPITKPKPRPEPAPKVKTGLAVFEGVSKSGAVIQLEANITYIEVQEKDLVFNKYNWVKKIQTYEGLRWRFKNNPKNWFRFSSRDQIGTCEVLYSKTYTNKSECASLNGYVYVLGLPDIY